MLLHNVSRFWMKQQYIIVLILAQVDAKPKEVIRLMLGLQI